MSIRQSLRQLLANRHTPEARAFYEAIARYVGRRVHSVARSCCADLFSSSELDEIVAEVLLQLVSGSLASFRGDTMGELFGFVRTVSDRALWRSARRRRRERATLQGEAESIERWNAHLASPDEAVRMVPETQLSATDEAYLRELLESGSKVELARRSGVSRAAVTQRVQRIRRRIAQLSEQDRDTVDAWLEVTARQVLEERAEA